MHWAVERILVGRPDSQTIAKYARGKDRYLGLVLLLSAALLGLAITQPMITTAGYLDLFGEFSLLTAMAEFFKAGRGGLALVIALITIFLPVLLLSTAFEVWYKYEIRDDRYLRKARLLHQLGRLWLFILTLVLVAIFTVARAETAVTLHFGVYYLVVSLALQKLVAARLQPLINAVQFVEDQDG